MNLFVYIIGGMALLTIIRMMLTSKREQEKLRLELGLPKDHPSNKSIEGYLFHNHFQFFMVLLMITVVGFLIREAIIIYCNC